MTRGQRDARLRIALGSVLALIALNAFGGGAYGMAGADGVPTAWLRGTPFVTYLVPSVILFVVVGGAFLFAAVAVIGRSPDARVLVILAEVVGAIWLASQLAIIGYVSWMQPLTAGVLVLALVLAWRLLGARASAARG